MKTRVAGMIAVAGTAIALLTASLAVAVEPTWLTEDSFGAPEVEFAAPQSPVDPEATADDIVQFEANHEARVNAPQAILERENSVGAFADFGSSAAASLFIGRFSEMLQALTTLPSDPVIEAEEILEVNGGSSVSIDPAGERESSLVVSDAPLRNEDNKFLDNSLSLVSGDFVPEAALIETTIPGTSDGQIEFPESGVSIGLNVPVADSTPGQVLSSAPGEDDLLFYPNTEVDTDTAVSATLGGVETFSILRSEESPEALSFEYGMPEGAVLSSTEDGGAVITDGGDGPLAQVFPPYAVDAQGSFVPVTLSVDGDSIVLGVDHQGADVAYPILVDPVTHLRDWWTNGSGINYAGWAFNQSGSTNYVGANSCPSAVLPGDPCGGTGAGLYTSAQPGYNYPAGSMGYWTFTAPGGASSSITGANLGSWRFRKGASTNGNPYAFYALGNTGTSMTTTTNTGGSNYGLTGSSNNTKYLHVGLATNANVTLPSGSTNWRYNRLAGFSLSMTDGEEPSLTMSGAPTGWLKDNTNFTVTANAADPGLGLGWIQAHYGGSWTNYWAGWCTGTYGAECPKNAAPTMTFNTSGFSSGVNGIYTKAIDIITGTDHETVSGFNFKVDKEAPSISVASEISDGAWVRDEVVGVQVDTDDAHSGVASIQMKLDGLVQDTNTQACSSGACPMDADFNADLTELSSGPHQLTLTVTDHAGNIEAQVIDFSVDVDAPQIELSEALALFTDSEADQYTSDATIEELGLPGYEIGVNGFDGEVESTTSGISDLRIWMNEEPGPTQPQSLLFEHSYSCDVDCESYSDWNDDVVLHELDIGQYRITVQLEDAAGNVSVRDVSFEYTAVIPEGNFNGVELETPPWPEEELDLLPDDEEGIGFGGGEHSRHSTECEAKIDWPHPSSHNPGRVGGGGRTTCLFSGDRPNVISWLYVNNQVVDRTVGKLGNGNARRTARAIVSTPCRNGARKYRVVNVHWVLYHHVTTPAPPTGTAKSRTFSC